MARVKQSVGITLELTWDEAQFLRNLLGNIKGVSHNVAGKHGHSIYSELANFTRRAEHFSICISDEEIRYNPLYKDEVIDG